VINHGGHGIVTTAIAAGLPQLTIPLGRDQPNNAARVHAAGVGLRLRGSPSSLLHNAAISPGLTSVIAKPGRAVSPPLEEQGDGVEGPQLGGRGTRRSDEPATPPQAVASYSRPVSLS
jgi:UDP-glucoronosyl and UDP-glucosyl transferase